MEDVTNLAITDQTFESNCNSLIQDAQNISTQSQCHSTGTILTHTNLNPNTANQPKLNTTIYYMPHHAVYKPSSTTTKTRVVFNASAKTNTGISLNDVLCVGPTVQADNFAILLKFRQHQFAIMADIAKMYRQIMIHPTQQNLQRILYRDDVHSPIKHYKLKTVTYGTASASYLATRCINQLAYEHLDQYPEASRVILSSFYVDDLLTGSNNIDHAVKLQTEINTIISSAGMSLRKWVSNEITILKSIPENHRETCNEQTIIKALGICWDPKSDILSFIINPIERIKVNKRNVLSQIAKIYDPIGWIAPVVLKAKIFMKGLWLININWDEDLPSDYADEWIKFRNTFDILNNIKIPRYIIIHNACTIDLHGFSDGSEKAYGAALYIRSVSADGEVSSKLLCAKSRVAPVNQKSLARLELCGALLLSKLSQRVLKSLDVKFDSVTLWSDSTIVLSWIKTTPASLKTFVANRVAQIQEATQHFSWKHIATADNPADSVSRGYMPKEIVNSAMWWHGPTFFSQPVHEWPQTIINIQPADPAYNDEFKSLTTLILQKNDLLNVIEYHSNFTKLRRVIAYVRRFANNLKAKSEKLSQSFINDHLTVAELNAAEQFIIRISQQTTFADEIKLLKAEKNVSSNSPLKFLNPFIDKNDIMRVGGRIQNASNASYDQIHQVILPKHHLSHIIISELHISFGHPAQQALLAIVRQRFWPLSAKTTIRRIIHQCIRCYRAKPLHLDQFMGNLPNKRITPSHPFENCGVDYAGPLNIKLSKTRKPSTTKAYIAIFVCFSTKAIHIELVSDLTTDAFLAALDRFIARRGICRHIHSDNGSNFIGANTELRKFYRKLSEGVSSQSIINYCSKNNIQWHFIPPRAPEFGGLWEAAVKSTKYHLKRIVADAMLTFEELNTVLVKIEAILNSRPLTALSNDPADLEVLTPGHFLVGRPLTSRPEHDVTHLHLNRLDRWQRLSQIQQQFWTRWSREYLHQLQIRTKNYRHHVKFKEGDLVLLMEDNVPPLQWIIGRISQVFLGNDKIIRVVNVRTAKGVFKRAVNKLCLLPVESD